jgi:hypothetical protein
MLKYSWNNAYYYVFAQTAIACSHVFLIQTLVNGEGLWPLINMKEYVQVNVASWLD